MGQLKSLLHSKFWKSACAQVPSWHPKVMATHGRIVWLGTESDAPGVAVPRGGAGLYPPMRAKHPGELEVQKPCGIFQNSEPRKWPSPPVEEFTWSPSIAPWLQDQQVARGRPHLTLLTCCPAPPALSCSPQSQQSEGPSQQDNRPVTKDKGDAQRPCPGYLVC